VTTYGAIVDVLGGFRGLGDGRFERLLDPWSPWGSAGARAAQTLVIARLGASRDLTVPAALAAADGVQFGVVLGGDGRPMVKLGASGSDAAQLRLDQIVALTGGRAKVILFEDPRAVEPTVDHLMQADVDLREVLATSRLREVVDTAHNHGLRTGLVVTREELPGAEWPGGRPLADGRPDFVTVPQGRRETEILIRSRTRPPSLSRVTSELAMRAALQYLGAHAIFAARPARVLALRNELARVQGEE
jgi:hypothetical protein